jgi:hypothetical protein
MQYCASLCSLLRDSQNALKGRCSTTELRPCRVSLRALGLPEVKRTARFGTRHAKH